MSCSFKWIVQIFCSASLNLQTVNDMSVDWSAEKNLPAMRRQTMHMENATSITMGSCKKNRSQRIRLTVTFTAAEDRENTDILTVRNFQSFCTRRGVGPSDSSTAKLPRNRSMESWNQQNHMDTMTGLIIHTIPNPIHSHIGVHFTNSFTEMLNVVRGKACNMWLTAYSLTAILFNIFC